MIKKLGPIETYKIYIGMNDKDKLQQLITTEDFISIVRGICEEYEIAFSMDEQVGGYMMANGIFITERSLILSISGFNEDQIMQLAETLKVVLNQETILVTMEKPELFIVGQ